MLPLNHLSKLAISLLLLIKTTSSIVIVQNAEIMTCIDFCGNTDLDIFFSPAGPGYMYDNVHVIYRNDVNMTVVNFADNFGMVVHTEDLTQQNPVYVGELLQGFGLKKDASGIGNKQAKILATKGTSSPTPSTYTEPPTQAPSKRVPTQEPSTASPSDGTKSPSLGVTEAPTDSTEAPTPTLKRSRAPTTTVIYSKPPIDITATQAPTSTVTTEAPTTSH